MAQHQKMSSSFPTFEREKLPSVVPNLFLIALFAAILVANIVTIASGTLNAISATLAAINVVLWTRTYRQTIKKREAIRESNWKHFLDWKIPPLAEPTNWSEIDRAMGCLLEEGVEPTVERAEAYLRSETTTANYLRERKVARQRERERDKRTEHLRNGYVEVKTRSGVYLVGPEYFD